MNGYFRYGRSVIHVNEDGDMLQVGEIAMGRRGRASHYLCKLPRPLRPQARADGLLV